MLIKYIWHVNFVYGNCFLSPWFFFFFNLTLKKLFLCLKIKLLSTKNTWMLSSKIYFIAIEMTLSFYLLYLWTLIFFLFLLPWDWILILFEIFSRAGRFLTLGRKRELDVCSLSLSFTWCTLSWVSHCDHPKMGFKSRLLWILPLCFDLISLALCVGCLVCWL